MGKQAPAWSRRSEHLYNEKVKRSPDCAVKRGCREEAVQLSGQGRAARPGEAAVGRDR